VGIGAPLGVLRIVEGAGWGRWAVRAPLQGLVDFFGFTQGVALGCDRVRRWRGLEGGGAGWEVDCATG
jgi:hypothetical protein